MIEKKFDLWLFRGIVYYNCMWNVQGCTSNLWINKTKSASDKNGLNYPQFYNFVSFHRELLFIVTPLLFIIATFYFQRLCLQFNLV